MDICKWTKDSVWSQQYKHVNFNLWHIQLVGCCGFNVTFSDISAIYKWWDSCPVSKFSPAAGTQRHGQLGVFSVPSLPRHGHPDVRRHHAVRVCRELNPDLLIHMPACYLYATAAGLTYSDRWMFGTTNSNVITIKSVLPSGAAVGYR